MTAAWLVNALGLFATTVSALLLFLYLQAAPRFGDDLKTPGVKLAYVKYQGSLRVAVGLLAVWLVIQCLAIVLL